jgi:hypothetical protein
MSASPAAIHCAITTSRRWVRVGVVSAMARTDVMNVIGTFIEAAVKTL